MTVGGYKEALITHQDVCYVESCGFDRNEELSWPWFWCGTKLDLEGLTFGEGDYGEVGGHCSLLSR